MSSGDESIDIPDEIDLIEDIEGEVDNPIETIEDQAQEETPQTNENKDSDDEDSSKKVVKPKRVVRNPQPKLNEHTLRTAKGLSALPGHFKRVKFKGRGHEEHDLNILMKTYEYWCHRLYPKFPFDACIARLETLGTKKGTQVLMKKIRLGMDIGDEEKKVVSDEEKEEEAPMTEGFVDTFDDRFDQLLNRPTPSQRPVETETTEEQLEKIRQNRLRAEALRKQRIEKMRAATQNESNTTSGSNERDEMSTQSDIFSSVGEEIETSASKQPERYEKSPSNDGSDDEETISQNPRHTKRTQVFSSDEEEMPVDADKSTHTSNENDSSTHRKQIQRIESDDDMETNDGHSATGTENLTRGEAHTDEVEDNEEVGFDKILNIVNENPSTVLNSNRENESVTSGEKPDCTGKKKTRTIDSDEEMDTDDKLNGSHGGVGKKVHVQSGDENEEVDFDQILSIVNEDDPVTRKPSGAEEKETSSSVNPRRKKPQTIESDDEMDIPTD